MSFPRNVSNPSSPQIFFRQAPPQLPIEDELDLSENPCSPTEEDQPVDMGRYCENSLSSSDCTRRSILSIQDEPFTPVRNLAILNYQRRSIFSARADSHSSGTDSSLNSQKFCGNIWSSLMWKGHERICLVVVLLSVLLIVVGGIVGIYFAFQVHNSYPTSLDVQQSPRMGLRAGVDEGATGNDLTPPLDGVKLRDPESKTFYDFEPHPSGELGCNELYTFRCGVNQCLPIPLWCDGKTDCEDKSDEPEECAMHCPPRFFACLNHSSIRFDKSHDWCIPEILVCNGVPDCDDLSDEYFCRCNHEQIRCSDGICKNRTEICRGADACSSDTSEPLHCNCLDDLPQNKFCDGFPDCADNLDEIECSANCDSNDQFSCWRSGYGCVHKTSICDGIRDCANGEDEEECLRLLADSESMPDNIDYVGISRPSGILLVRRWGSEFSPVCLDAEFDLQSDSRVGTLFCNHFGYARLLYAEPLLLPKSPPSSATKFYAYNVHSAGGDPSRHFVPMKQCPSGNVLRIHCTEMMCEPRSNRNKGVVVTENGELVLKRHEQFFPFVVQIYKKVWNSWVLRCGGVIVHPLWLLTSSECIDKNGYFKSLSGPYWQATNPKLMQSGHCASTNRIDEAYLIQNRDISMIAMPPETVVASGRSELVLARLDRRLECHDFLRPICLPDLGLPPISGHNATIQQLGQCLTLGWNITANRASSIPYPTELHVARDIQVVPTEECSRLLSVTPAEPLDSVYCVRMSSRENSNLLSDPGGALVCTSPGDTKYDLMGVLVGFKTRVTGNYVRVYALYSRLDQHLHWILREFVNSDATSP